MRLASPDGGCEPTEVDDATNAAGVRAASAKVAAIDGLEFVESLPFDEGVQEVVRDVDVPHALRRQRRRSVASPGHDLDGSAHGWSRSRSGDRARTRTAKPALSSSGTSRPPMYPVAPVTSSASAWGQSLESLSTHPVCCRFGCSTSRRGLTRSPHESVAGDRRRVAMASGSVGLVVPVFLGWS